MNPFSVTFDLPVEIAQKLATGDYERVGGIIREVGSKQVVAWLRELDSTLPQTVTLPGILQTITAASLLNLGISAIGLPIILQRLGVIENNLRQIQTEIKDLNHKVDLGFYANFEAALQAATDAFTFENLTYRESRALEAISRFAEAQSIYKNLADKELEQKNAIAIEYLLTLSLAYLAQVHCYLELGESKKALARLQEGIEKLNSRFQKYVEVLLTDNPAIYLQPQLKGKISLTRLTKIYQWLNPNLDENAVFELQRDNLFELAKYSMQSVRDLPSPVALGVLTLKFAFSPNSPSAKHITSQKDELVKAMVTMESVIETSQRLQAYETEIRVIHQLGMSFQDWMQLAPTEAQIEKTDLMYILPSKPIAL